MLELVVVWHFAPTLVIISVLVGVVTGAVALATSALGWHLKPRRLAAARRRTAERIDGEVAARLAQQAAQRRVEWSAAHPYRARAVSVVCELPGLLAAGFFSSRLFRASKRRYPGGG
jgi:hypothetical protein